MPSLGPVLVGVKVVLIVQLTPVVALLVVSVGGQSSVAAKSPVVAMSGMNEAGPLLAHRLAPWKLLHRRFSVWACGGLVVPTWRLPKSTLNGLRVTTETSCVALA